MEPLASRYFRWALNDWDREIAEDFPFLRALGGTLASRSVELMETLSRSEQAELSRAMAKRFHPNAVALLRLDLTQRERSLLDHWDRWRRDVDGRQFREMRPQAERRRIAESVRAALAFLGPAEAMDGPLSWRHSWLSDDGWSVTTYVDLAGRYHDISYEHDFAASTERIRSISLCSWLGIAGGTKWNLGSGEDPDTGAAYLARVCRHFLTAGPALAR